MSNTRSIRGAASLAVLAMAATAGAAQAQDGQSSPTTIDDIIVTAQKREQNLQDVPIVVTTLPAEILQDSGVKDIKDLTILTPGLSVVTTVSQSNVTARIRNIGTVGDNAGLEPAVGIVIDGVYRPRNGVSFGDLGELERIEVLKGPQGTLFGKNTSAGVISVITQAPEFTFGAQGEVTAGNYNALGVSGSITGPLMDDVVAGRLYFANRERDGFNTVVGQYPGGSDQDANQNVWTVRGQLLVLPSDNTRIQLIADYSERDEFCCAAIQTRTGGTAAIINALAAPSPGLANPARPDLRVAYANRPNISRTEDSGVSAHFDLDLDWGTLTSITAYREFVGGSGVDADFTAADVLYRGVDDQYFRFETLSQELRLAGATDSFDWLVGAFYAKEDLDWVFGLKTGDDYEAYLSLLLSSGTNPNFVSVLNGRPAGTSYASGAGAADLYEQQDTSIALFTNDTWHVTDRFDVTLGLRYTWDEKSVDTFQTNTDGGIGCATAKARRAAGVWTAMGIPAGSQGTILTNMCLGWFNDAFNNRNTFQERTEKEWSGTLKGSYRWSDAFMTYASYARGYKGGGYNLDRAQSSNGLPTGGAGITPVLDTSFAAEMVDSYELGFKSNLLDDRLLFNVTAFHQAYENFQLNAFLGASFQVRAIPEATSKGADVDMLWFTPIDGLTVQGGVTYADTRFGDDPVPGDPTNSQAMLPGSQLSFAPLWSASGSVTYEAAFGDGMEGRLNIGAKYQSDHNTGSDLLPLKEQEAYTLVNARIGFGPEDERWTIELWAQNLFDTQYSQTTINGPLQGSSGLTAANPVYNPALDTITYDALLGAPRTFGLTLRAKY